MFNTKINGEDSPPDDNGLQALVDVLTEPYYRPMTETAIVDFNAKMLQSLARIAFDQPPYTHMVRLCYLFF